MKMREKKKTFNGKAVAEFWKKYQSHPEKLHHLQHHLQRWQDLTTPAIGFVTSYAQKWQPQVLAKKLSGQWQDNSW